MRNSTHTRITILGRLPGSDTWEPIDENPEAEEDVPGVLVVVSPSDERLTPDKADSSNCHPQRIRESLNFANTGQLKERLRRLELYGQGDATGSGRTFHPSDAPNRDQAVVVVFHLSDVREIDASALAGLREGVES